MEKLVVYLYENENDHARAFFAPKTPIVDKQNMFTVLPIINGKDNVDGIQFHFVYLLHLSCLVDTFNRIDQLYRKSDDTKHIVVKLRFQWTLGAATYTKNIVSIP